MKKRVLSAVLCCTMMAGTFAFVPSVLGVGNDSAVTVSAARNYGGLYYVNKNIALSYYYGSGQKSKTIPKGAKINVTTDGRTTYGGVTGNITYYINNGYTSKIG